MQKRTIACFIGDLLRLVEVTDYEQHGGKEFWVCLHVPSGEGDVFVDSLHILLAQCIMVLLAHVSPFVALFQSARTHHIVKSPARFFAEALGLFSKFYLTWETRLVSIYQVREVTSYAAECQFSHTTC